MSMSVQDLINELSQCDPNLPVFTGVGYDNDTSFTNPVKVFEAGVYLVEQSFMGSYFEPRDEFECSCGEHDDGESCDSNTGLPQGVFIQ